MTLFMTQKCKMYEQKVFEKNNLLKRWLKIPLDLKRLSILRTFQVFLCCKLPKIRVKPNSGGNAALTGCLLQL